MRFLKRALMCIVLGVTLVGCDPTSSREYRQLEQKMAESQASNDVCKKNVEALQAEVSQLHMRVEDLENAAENRFQEASSLEVAGSLIEAAEKYRAIAKGFPESPLSGEAAERAAALESKVKIAVRGLRNAVASCLRNVGRLEEIRMEPTRWTSRGLDMNWASQQEFRQQKVQKAIKESVKEIDRILPTLGSGVVDDALEQDIQECKSNSE